ncbi:MAG: hypothetical protein ACI8UR_001844 [Natronomonas sp.]|jgi:hypothetical protein
MTTDHPEKCQTQMTTLPTNPLPLGSPPVILEVGGSERLFVVDGGV